MRRAAQILLIATTLIPGALVAQTPAAPESNPAKRLLNHRADLSLTADQVKRLEEIDRRTTQQDAEIRARLETLRGKPMGEPLRMRDMSLEERQKLEASRAEVQPLMRELRTIHAQAAAAARAVLTPDQDARAAQFLFAGPGRGAGRGPAAGAGYRLRNAPREGMGPGPRAQWHRQHGAPGRWGW